MHESRLFLSARGLSLGSLLVGLALGARAVTACGAGEDGDDGPSGPPDGAGDASGTGTPAPPGTAPDGAALGDGASDDGGPPGRPSFCEGIVMRVSFDRGIAPDEGGGRARPDAGVVFVEGKYGRAVELTNRPDGGPAVFFDREREPGDASTPLDGGDAGALAEVFPQRQGSAAYWYRRVLPSVQGLESHVRPMGRGRPGLVVAQDRGRFGLFSEFSGPEVLVFRDVDLAPYRAPGGFEHVAYAWRAADADAGVRPLTRLALNGGLGVVLGDAGSAEAGPSDAGPNDAGELALPYRAETSAPQGLGGVLETLRVGGVTGTAPQGVFDDLVVWNRVLSFDEMADVFRAGVDVGTACR